jgi:hypothetical protein
VSVQGLQGVQQRRVADAIQMGTQAEAARYVAAQDFFQGGIGDGDEQSIERLLPLAGKGIASGAEEDAIHRHDTGLQAAIDPPFDRHAPRPQGDGKAVLGHDAFRQLAGWYEMALEHETAPLLRETAIKHLRVNGRNNHTVNGDGSESGDWGQLTRHMTK